MILADLTGKKFNRLTVIKRCSNIGKQTAWECLCECGKMIVATGDNLKRGHVQSCGCFRRDLCEETKLKHGDARRGKMTRVYRIWENMRHRCCCENADNFAYYGGRGIKVCDDWYNFESFRDWALSHGYRDDLTLDRRDNDGNYEPGNCRWATMKEQSNNRRNQSTHNYGKGIAL